MANVELASAYLTLLPDTSKIAGGVRKSLGEAEKGAGKSGKRMGRNMGVGAAAGMGAVASKIAAPVAAAFAAINVGKILYDSIQKASDLEQSRGGVAAIFKGQAGEIQQAAEGAAEAFGLSENSYNQLATVLGAQLKNKGIKDFTGQTQDLIGLGSDLAAMFGGTTSEAVDALSSLMRGERDPIERYGVSINEAAIKAELAANGQDKLTGAALEQAKAQATLKILMDQTADAQGATAREADTFASKQQRLNAKLEEFRTETGERLLPIATRFVDFLMDKALPAIEGLIDSIDFDKLSQFGDTLGDISGQAGDLFGSVDTSGFMEWVNNDLIPAGERLGDAWQDFAEVMEPIVTGVRDELFATLQENGPQIRSILGSIGNIATQAMDNWATAVENVTKVLGPLWKAIGPTVLEVLGNTWDLIIDVLEGAFKIIEGAFQVWSALWQGDFKGAWEGIKKIAEGFGKIVTGIIEYHLGNARAVADAIVSKIKDPFWNSVKWIKSSFKLGWSAITEIVSRPIEAARDAVGDALDRIETTFDRTRKAIGKSWELLKEAMAAPVDWVADNVVNPLIRGFNKVAGAVGITKLPEWAFNGFADGGFTGNVGTRNVAGFVHGGEFVMDAKTTAMAGGPRAMEALRSSIRGFYDGGYVPVPGGANRHGTGYPWASFAGDFPVPFGTPIKAWKDGVVALVRRLNRSYGHYVRINHDDGPQSLYAHMSRILVDLGQRVLGGQTIGRVGSTGNSTGPHLHFETMGGPYRGGKSSGLSDLFSGFLSPLAWLEDLITAPLRKLADAPGGYWGDLIAGLPGLIKDGMLDKISLFDDGGWLQPGHLAYNGLSRPEPVFTPGQWDKINGGGVSADDLRSALDGARLELDDSGNAFLRTSDVDSARRDAMRTMRSGVTNR